jgi:hypothetical protein
MGDSSEETKIRRDRREAVLRCRLRTQGNPLRRKGPRACERPRATITPLLQGSGPTWHRMMLPTSFTRPAQSTGPETNMELPQSDLINVERSDCGNGPAATIFPKSRPTQSKMRSSWQSHPRMNRS